VAIGAFAFQLSKDSVIPVRQLTDSSPAWGKPA